MEPMTIIPMETLEMRQSKKWKRREKIVKFANNVLIVLENLTGNGKNLKALRKVAGYDINIFKNQCLFYVLKIKCIRIHDIIKVN